MIANTCITREMTRERGNAETHRNRSQSVRPIEVEILTGIQDVEAADPGANRQRQQPGLPPAAPSGSQPSADRRNGHGQAEKELRLGRESLRERIPEHDRERHRRQRETERAQLLHAAKTKTADTTTTNAIASRATHRAARQLARRRYADSARRTERPPAG